jgi:glycosyltransferase involved in cell wall biosynthesis
MSIKILRIIARLNIGGPARNAVLLTEGLNEKGFDTVLICGEIPDDEGDMMYLAKERGVEPVIVPELGRDLSITNDWRAFWKIYKIICRERPDIVHTHTAKAGTLGRTAALLFNTAHFGCRMKGEGCKIVHTFHGHVLHSYFGKIKTWLFIWIEKILALFTDRITTVSESLKKELVERFRIAPERKFSVIELGLELDALLKLPLRESNSILNIGIVGRLVPIKNHKMLFRVLKKLMAYNLQLTAVVVGDGELREELERYIEKLGLGEMVEFKGWVKDLDEIYRDLDVVALTSLNEGTPVSIIEAMAAARPVVAAEAGGVPDVVKDGKIGYLVKVDDDDTFVDRMLLLLRDYDRRIRFGQYGRETVMTRFSKERLIEKTEKLYSEILKKNV